MLSTTTTSILTAVLATIAVNGWNWPDNAVNRTCALQPRVESCQGKSESESLDKSLEVDTCCSPVDGLVLTTQFWNTYTGMEDEGSVLPKGSWGIHGLWPDKCDGSYRQYCDLARQFDPRPSPNTTTGLPNGTVVPPWTGGDIITPTLEKWGKYDLLAFMSKYWKSRDYPDWDLWAHEYSKHATCFSTMDVGNDDSPNCYGPEYSNVTEHSIIDFFETAVLHDLQFPTYKWLEEGGIVPSNKTGVALSDMLDILTERSGAIPYIGCFGPQRDMVSEVWYYSHSLGRPQDGVVIPLNTTLDSNCNATSLIWYYERSEGSEA